MRATAQHPSDVRDMRAQRDSLALLETIMGPVEEWPVAVRFWSGSTIGPSDPTATVVLEHPWSLRSLLWPPTELNAGEAYIFGDVDVEGDIEKVFEELEGLRDLEWRRPAMFARLARLVLALPAPPAERDAHRAAELQGGLHSRQRDRSAVRYHYDVSNDFYRCWLDARMQYSCGYFRDPGDDLDTAQDAKLEHICRKLRLQPGDRLLDIGCGWGGLLEYAAANRGVRGLGVTLSEPQARLANERLRRAGVGDLARVEVCDYRDVEGEFDKLVSVGMVEHVGESKLPEYFGQAMRLLRPGGVFLNHGITTHWNLRPSPGPKSFVARYVFPDGELQPVSVVLAAAERAGFEVRDVEGLREHYARTLRHWVANLERQRERVLRESDDVTYRIWRLYMSGSAHNFDAGRLGIFQALLFKPCGGPSCLPPTRDDWYGSPASAS